MPIQLQCCSVVIRNDALQRSFPEGPKEFYRLARTGISYGDDNLTQASFMAEVDAEQFAKLLELRGLNRDEGAPDFVIVREVDRAVFPHCDWLVLFEYEKRLIGTLAGSDSRDLVVPASEREEYDPDAIQHFSSEEADERLEFVRRDDDVDVYRDKVTGKLLYSARFTETDDEIFRRSFEKIWQHHRVPGEGPVADVVQDKLKQEIGNMQNLAARNPDSDRVFLALGMAWFAIGQEQRAIDALEKAADLDPEYYVTLKEWAGVCLTIGQNEEALKICQRAVVIEPDNIELLGNLSVSQLLCGEVEKAKATIAHALQLNGSDEVNRNLSKRIAQVAAGKRDQPSTLQELMRRGNKAKGKAKARAKAEDKDNAKDSKTSLLGRLFGRK